MFITPGRCPACYSPWGEDEVCQTCGGVAEIYYEEDLPPREGMDMAVLQRVVDAARSRLAKYPNDGNARYVLGLNYVFMDLVPEGVAEIRRAADFLPEKVQIRYEAVALSAKNGRYTKENLVELNKVLSRQPYFKQALYLKGVILEKQGNIRPAVGAWQQAYQLDQDYEPASNSLLRFIEKERPYLLKPALFQNIDLSSLKGTKRDLVSQLNTPLPSPPPPLGETSMMFLEYFLPSTARRMEKIHSKEIRGYEEKLNQRDNAWEELENDLVTLSDLCLANYEARQIQPTVQPTLQQPGTRTLTIAERTVILDGAIQRYQKSGFRLVSKTDTTAQLYRPKEFSCCLAIILVFLLIGIILYFIYYLTKKDDSVFLEVDQFGKLHTRHR